jgi:hypothetical protein
MTKATEDALATLHGAVAVALTDAVAIKVIPATEDAPAQTVAPSAAHIMAAITFLKNNSITADASSNAELDELSAALKKRRLEQKDRMSKRTLDHVADTLHKDMGGLTQ